LQSECYGKNKLKHSYNKGKEFYLKSIEAKQGRQQYYNQIIDHKREPER